MGPRILTLAVLAVLLGGSVQAQPVEAVVRIRSHGCAGTVVATSLGETWILTCAHAFEGPAARRPLEVDCPALVPGRSKQEGIGIRLAKIDARADLALIHLPVGPVAFYAPVARASPRPGEAVLAVGYAKMGWPANVARYTVLDLQGGWLHTRERPTPGDSGGPLVNSAGELVATCTGYEGGPRGRGMYVPLQTIRSFMGLDLPGEAPLVPEARGPAPCPSPFG